MSSGAETATAPGRTPEEAVTAATETYLKISAQDDAAWKQAGAHLAQELDKDKTVEMWNTFADGKNDSSVGEVRAAVYRWAASKMKEDAKFEEVAAAVADALKTES